MSLIVKDNSGGEFEQVPEGNYIARCYQLVDLGTQTYDNQGEKKQQHKVLLAWEILDPEVKMQDGRPFSVYKRYTASLNERATLFADLQAWRGIRFTAEDLEGFDLRNVLGAYCAIQVLHETKGDRTYENVTAIMFTREKPEPINDLTEFDLSNPDLEVFASLSKNLQETIRKSPEGQGIEAVGALDETTERVDVQDFPPDDLSTVNMNSPEVQGTGTPAPAPKVASDDSPELKELEDALELVEDELKRVGKDSVLKRKVFLTQVLGKSQVNTMADAEKVIEAIEALDA